MDAFIIDGVFTPRASVKKGVSAYSEIHPQELVATCLRDLRQRHGTAIEQLGAAYMGCVSQVNDQGANLARNAVLLAGLDNAVSAATIDMCCGSGLESVNIAAALVSSGTNNIAIGGGVESMSRVRMGSDGGGMDGNNLVLRHDLFQLPQGICADFVATEESISRQELDAFALESHKKATKAREEKYFQSFYSYVRNKNNETLLTEDDHIRPDASLSVLESLPPAFAKLGADLAQSGVIGGDRPISKLNHVHTAGTSSGIADGASAVLLANRTAIENLHLKPRARILGTRSLGSDPIAMLTGPAVCCAELLKSCGMATKDVDLWEINEAFAVVPLQTIRKLGNDPQRVNITGGAIARGHPLGATGAILLATVLAELEHENLSVGCVVLCVAGGQSVATLIERC